ncbi:hypothetical protein GGF46_003156 [Coemansia sp. RSA 552]|nr:hypothetical protein GGF46_003156 [Coemansia sp. RSA 552]
MPEPDAHQTLNIRAFARVVDRRPIDPPPVIQLTVRDPSDPYSQQYIVSPAYFMQVLLLDESGQSALLHIKGHVSAAMAGSMVSPLHTLRDTSSEQGAYFVFSDLSVRIEGAFRLRFVLFEMDGQQVHNRASITSDVFFVYSPKRFPGMMESTLLSRVFASQGLRIRIRTEAGTKKRGKRSAHNAPTKRARLSDSCSSSAPLTTLHIQSASDSADLGNSGLSVSPPSSSHVHRPLGTSDAGPSGLLIFQQHPFTAYQENKENLMPSASQQSIQFNQMLRVNFQGQRSPDACSGSVLDMDDIAAVALLDSLSNGPHRHSSAAAATGSSIARLLEPPGFGSLSQADNSTLFPISAAGPALHAKQPTAAHSSGLNAGLPFSNYRLSAVRSPDPPIPARPRQALYPTSLGLQPANKGCPVPLSSHAFEPTHSLCTPPLRTPLAHSLLDRPGMVPQLQMPPPGEQWNNVGHGRLPAIGAPARQRTSESYPGMTGAFI